MRVTKFGHSCFLIEESGLTILFDPGNLSAAQNQVSGIDLVLITHEHQDHLDLASLKAVLTKNPGAKILTNRGVGAALRKQGIKYELLEDGRKTTFKNVLIEGFGKEHAVIYPTLPPVANTGYFIAGRFFYPGDAFYNPGKPVEILALPATAPWSKLQEVVDYMKKVNPKVCFPVHDGYFKQVPGSIYKIPEAELAKAGGRLVILDPGKEMNF